MNKFRVELTKTNQENTELNLENLANQNVDVILNNIINGNVATMIENLSKGDGIPSNQVATALVLPSENEAHVDLGVIFNDVVEGIKHKVIKDTADLYNKSSSLEQKEYLGKNFVHY